MNRHFCLCIRIVKNVIFSENLMPRYGDAIKFLQKRVEKVDFQIIKNRYTFLTKKHIHMKRFLLYILHVLVCCQNSF